MTESTSIELTSAELATIVEFIASHAGIKMDERKRELIKSRLGGRLRALRLGSFREYFDYVSRDGEERTRLVDSLTTNLTYFFREPQHFSFVRSRVLAPRAASPSPLRIWSAGCSSGEEPYTLAMLTREVLGAPEIWRKCEPRILATDLSTRVLAKAKTGIYPHEAREKIPEPYRSRFVESIQTDEGSAIRMASELRRTITFGQLNFMTDWPMKGPFDVIFCRNVMIYFDASTKERLVARFHRLLRSGGYFFVSLAESLNGLQHPFRYVAPGIYTP